MMREPLPLVQPRTPAGETRRADLLRDVTRLCVRYAERYIPDPFLYSVILAFITVAAALVWMPTSPVKVIDAWYGGMWAILTFAMQMALILATGVTLASRSGRSRSSPSPASGSRTSWATA